MAEKQGIKQIAANRQARHEYFVEESMEAGIELFGTEVPVSSPRASRASSTSVSTASGVSPASRASNPRRMASRVNLSAKLPRKL